MFCMKQLLSSKWDYVSQLGLCYLYLAVYGRFISPPSPLSPQGDQALSLSLKLGPRGALQVHSLAGGGSEFSICPYRLQWNYWGIVPF